MQLLQNPLRSLWLVGYLSKRGLQMVKAWTTAFKNVFMDSAHVNVINKSMCCNLSLSVFYIPCFFHVRAQRGVICETWECESILAQSCTMKKYNIANAHRHKNWLLLLWILSKWWCSTVLKNTWQFPPMLPILERRFEVNIATFVTHCYFHCHSQDLS